MLKQMSLFLFLCDVFILILGRSWPSGTCRTRWTSGTEGRNYFPQLQANTAYGGNVVYIVWSTKIKNSIFKLKMSGSFLQKSLAEFQDNI